MPQARETFVTCDVDQIPVSNAKCKERPGSNGMEQVREILVLIDRRRLDGLIVASNFILRRVQPSKERAHPGYLFRGDTDGMREVPEEIDREEAKRRVAMTFNLVGRLKIREPQRPFTVGNLPPWVRIKLFCYVCSIWSVQSAHLCA